MTPHAKELRSKLELRRRQVKDTEAEVAALEQGCTHAWAEPKYDPIIHPAYQTHQFEMPIGGHDPMIWVPEEQKPRWSRECRHCGKVETTTRQDTQTTKVPKF